MNTVKDPKLRSFILMTLTSGSLSPLGAGGCQLGKYGDITTFMNVRCKCSKNADEGTPLMIGKP